MKEYYMFNKPRGPITARRDARHRTVMDYFPEEKRDELFPVGRLDKDTEGLLLVTNDGTLAFELMQPDRAVPKKYFFWAQGVLTDEKISEIESGVRIYSDRAETAPSRIEVLETSTMKGVKHLLIGEDVRVSNRRGDQPVVSGYITITEGKKHQVKRMLRYAGCRVVYLKRVSIGELNLDESLSPGEYRSLSEQEITLLTAATGV